MKIKALHQPRCCLLVPWIDKCTFQRSFCVPEGVDRDNIAAGFAKGVLTITMPKTAKAVEQKKIDVKAAA